MCPCCLILQHTALPSTKFMLQTNLKQEIEKEHSCFKYDFVLDYIHSHPGVPTSHEPQPGDLALCFKELEWLSVLFSMPFVLRWHFACSGRVLNQGIVLESEHSPHQIQQYLDLYILAFRTVGDRNYATTTQRKTLKQSLLLFDSSHPPFTINTHMSKQLFWCLDENV